MRIFKLLMTAVFLLLLFPIVSDADADRFCSVSGHCNLVFPGDHGAHPCYRTEWWYYTGNLQSPSGRQYGFQLTFFRVAMADPGGKSALPENASAWRTKDLYFAHAALSDIGEKRFYHVERMARGALGMAGAREESAGIRIFLGPWSAEIGRDAHKLKAATDSFSMRLECTVRKGPVMHGLRGYSRKGKEPGSASCYYSFPRLEVTGSLKVRGEEIPVRGLAWMDHEFGSVPLEQGLTGWDWFGIQLSDHTEVMIYLLRLASGGYSPASSGTFVNESGEAVHLSGGDFSVEVLDHWKSGRSGARYPSRWHIRVPSLQMELRIVPNMSDQELVTRRTTRVTYWEGSVTAGGRSRQANVTGTGYVELTGYAKPFRLPSEQ